MARTALPTFDIRPHYHYLVKNKLDADTAYTIVGQLKNIQVNGQADQKTFKRVGDVNATKRAGSIAWDVTITLFADNDIEEVARALGTKKPATGGWIGTETITLDPTKITDLQIEGYDGTGVSAVLQTTETLPNFTPAGLKAGVDAESDARTFEITGSCDSWSLAPSAALGA
jgi:hypothetical protein